jgi:hypothetical protein
VREDSNLGKNDPLVLLIVQGHPPKATSNGPFGKAVIDLIFLKDRWTYLEYLRLQNFKLKCSFLPTRLSKT